MTESLVTTMITIVSSATTTATTISSITTIDTTVSTVTTIDTTESPVTTMVTTVSSATTVATTTISATTVASQCIPQITTGGILYSVINPTSSTYPNYTYYAYTWVATSSSATLSFSFRHNPGGWMLDDVKVYHGSTQMIINGGFEIGDLTGWTYSGTCFYYVGEVFSGSTYAKSGNYYYYDRCSQFGDTISQAFPTVAGDTYNISFWLTNYLCCDAIEIANITLF